MYCSITEGCRRWTTRLRTPSSQYVKEEHDKCNVRTKHLFVMITDEHYEQPDLLQENEIVLSPEYDEGGMGCQLALLRLHNHVHRRGAEATDAEKPGSVRVMESPSSIAQPSERPTVSTVTQSRKKYLRMGSGQFDSHR